MCITSTEITIFLFDLNWFNALGKNVVFLGQNVFYRIDFRSNFVDELFFTAILSQSLMVRVQIENLCLKYWLSKYYKNIFANDVTRYLDIKNPIHVCFM